MGRSWKAQGALALLAAVAACTTPTISAMRPPDTARPAPLEPLSIPQPDAAALRAPAGYRCEAVVTGLTYPTSVEVDDAGNLYVAEAGAAPGDPWGQPRVLRITPQGDLAVLTDRLVAPVTDLLWHEGRLFVSHRGRISAIGPDGTVQDLVTGLPSLGEHGNTQLAIGPQNKLYFGQGTVTNSGVVGLDDFLEGWLVQFPDACDRPARDLRVSTDTFRTVNPFLLAGGEGSYTTDTEPFAPFGGETVDADDEDGRLAIAHERPTGCIYRCELDGSALEAYAWGLRNPVGVAWSNDGQLYVANQGMAERGSRPIANAPDEVWLVKQNAWYGWPDYAGGQPITQHHFRASYGGEPEFILENHPPVEQPLVALPHGSAVAKLARPVGGRWGDPRSLFLAVMGECCDRGASADAGPRIVRLDPINRRVEMFMAGSDERTIDQGLGSTVPGFASAGLRRPFDVVFAPGGDALYVVDLGVVTVLPTKLPTVRPYPGTGVVWRLTPSDVAQVLPRPGISLQPPYVGTSGK